MRFTRRYTMAAKMYDRTVSMMVKTLPVYCQVNPKQTISEYVSGVGKQLVESMGHDIYSFAEISRNYQLKSDVMFVYQGDSFNFERICGADALQIPFEIDTQRCLSMDLFVIHNQFVLQADYRKDYYLESTIQRIAECIENVAIDFMRKESIGQVGLISEKQSNVIRGFNQTEVCIYVGIGNAPQLFSA